MPLPGLGSVGVGVLVGTPGIGVFVGTRTVVAVGGIGVLVGGTTVAIGGTGVLVGGTTVAVGNGGLVGVGDGVNVGVADGAGVDVGVGVGDEVGIGVGVPVGTEQVAVAEAFSPVPQTLTAATSQVYVALSSETKVTLVPGDWMSPSLTILFPGEASSSSGAILVIL